MKYLVAYTYRKGNEVGTGASLNCVFAHDPPTAEDVNGMQRLIAEKEGNDVVVITNWLPLSDEDGGEAVRDCYNCGYGGDGEEVDDCGHCWLHNGEPDFKQPDKKTGCDEWRPMEET